MDLNVQAIFKESSSSLSSFAIVGLAFLDWMTHNVARFYLYPVFAMQLLLISFLGPGLPVAPRDGYRSIGMG